MKKKIGFIGSGYMAENLVKGFVSFLDPKQIFTTDKREEKSQKLSEKYNTISLKHNEELLDVCDIVIIAIKPQDFFVSLEPLCSHFQKEHIVLSLMAGIKISHIQSVISNTENLIKIIPNTPTSVLKGIIGVELAKESFVLEKLLKNLLSPLGEVVFVTQEEVPSFTVACSSGIGFVYEIMEYWKEWLEEHGFEKKKAEIMVKKTFLGASELCQKDTKTFLELQKQVASKKGVTEEGLKAMREHELERALRVSFEKALLREKELSSNSF